MRLAPLLLCVALLGAGCAAATRQTDAILMDRGSLPEARRVEGVSFIEQSRNYCGPATLAMALAWAGHSVSVDSVAEQVFTPGKKGALQLDMISASRRQGMMAMQISGMPALLKEIDAGHPVILLENQAFTWYPKWHYFIAFGYDLAEPSLLVHSGGKKDWAYSLRRFERNWEYSGHWGLVVLRPGELSAAASEAEHSAAAAGLEQVGHLKEAELSYKAILGRWPTSLGALIGMGNITFARKEAAKSVVYLEQAVKYHPENAAAWHNLALAQNKAGRKRDAKKSALRALSLAPETERPVYQASLAEEKIVEEEPRTN